MKELAERQQWFWRRMSILIPPVFYGIYAISKYQLPQIKALPAMGVSLFSIVGLVKLGLSSSNGDIDACNRELYETYRDEVTKPEYRGLKLFNGRKAYQVDNREFTTSNFDNLKELVMKQGR